MKAIKKSSWEKLNEDYKSEINGQKYILSYNEDTNATILEPVTIINDMIKAKITENVGTSKYVVSYSNGTKKHPDGSEFFDVKIFKSKLKAFKFYNSLLD